MLQKTEQEETRSTNRLSADSKIQAEMSHQDEALSPDQELAQLAACIEAACKRNRGRQRTWRTISWSFILGIFSLLLGLLIAAANAQLPSPKMAFMMAVPIVVGMIGCAFGGLAWTRRGRQAERAAAKKLAGMEDVRAVTPILDALTYIELGSLKVDLWKALILLLPRMSEAEVMALGKEHHSGLAVYTRIWDSPYATTEDSAPLGGGPLIGNKPLLGILHVLTHVGQNRFEVGAPLNKTTVTLLPLLEKWAEGKGAGQDPAVQQSAAVCRDAIQQKMALAESGEQLLRASHLTPARPETLLRAAQSGEQTDPQELLRPGRSE